MMSLLLLLLVVVPLSLPLITAQPRSFFAGYDVDGTLTITPADSDAPFQWLPNSAAWAQYTDYNHTTDGWSYLNVKTSGNFTADQQSYAAGFLEGSLSALQIWQYVYNQELSKKVDSKVQSFLNENAAYMRSQIQAHSLNDSYWAQVALVYRQLDGVVDGYNSVNDELGLPPLVEQDIFLLNIQDELDDIWPAVHGQEPPHILRDGRGKCSAIVRILPDLSELFVAHTTWSDFPGMLRIYKNYEMNVMTITNSTKIIPGHRSSFPSYPGMLFSGDDFYLLSSGLVVQETTIGNTNASRSIYIQPRTVLEWMRNIVANRLATDGSTWTDIFGRENSGTYDNQFMVVNYNLFHPGKPLVPNTLWIIEQIPGMVKSADVTDILINQGYWSSYNIAFFPQIFNASGGWEEVAKAGINGDFFRYDKAPRAQIFKRDAPNIQTLHDLETFMRYNKFKTDPLARCNCTPPFSGENAIAARCDLNPIDGSYPISSLGHRPHGATDAKIATYELFQSFANKAVNGPTHDDQPVFAWATSDYKTLRHVGLPDSFDFDWTTIDWSKH